MNCPRCGNAWDVSKNSCLFCGFNGRMTSWPEQMAYPDATQQKAAQPGFFGSHTPGSFAAADPQWAEPPVFQPPSGSLSESAQFSSPGFFSSGPRSVDFQPPRPEPYMAAPPGDEMLRSPSSDLRYPSGGMRAYPSAQQPAPSSVARPLLPGTLLRGSRYRLQELLECQNWISGVFEAAWIGYDTLRRAPVMICEVVTPESISLMTRSMLHTATLALLAVGRHPHIAALLDAFSDQGRSFFVSELVEGESLMTLLRRLGGPLPERDVVELCLQMSEVLDLLARQSPPITHGLIRPEHIYLTRGRTPHYILGNFSIILAGGATQFIVGMDRAHISPYATPEFMRGSLDGGSDLFSLMATAYHVLTRNVPIALDGIVTPAQVFNSTISVRFNAILAKGLSAAPGQRYQYPSELRQDLLALRSVSGDLVARSNGAFSERNQLNDALAAAANASSPGVAQPFPIKMPILEDDKEKVFLLPMPEDLPPMREGRDRLGAVLILTLILLGLVLVTVASNFFS